MKHVILAGLLASFCLIPSFGFSQVLSTTGTHTVSVCPDSTVWTWGFARLGDEPGASRKPIPVQVKGPGGTGFLQQATDVATSGGATYVILADSTLWAWGAGSSGRLGTGNTSSQDYPVQVLGPNGVGVMDSAVAVTGQYQSGFVLRADGTVWGWGWNGTGVLGDGTYFNSRYSPVQVQELGGLMMLDSIVAIASGAEFAIALDVDGSVWAWGRDYYGEVGQGTSGPYYFGAQKVKAPTGPGFLQNVTAIDAGGNFAAALLSDGSVWTWGENSTGKLGEGSFLSSDLPVRVKNSSGTGFLTDVTQIKTGQDHMLALTSLGELYAWGLNINGQLGDPGLGEAQNLPVKVNIPTSIERIYAEDDVSAFINTNGELFMWGKNNSGPLGNGILSVEAINPSPIFGQNGNGYLQNVAQLSAGYESQHALLANGQVMRWGETATISIISGNRIPSATPVFVPDSFGTGILNNIQKVSAGENHTLALTNSGVAIGWGATGNGQLSNQPFSYANNPVAIKYFGGGILDQVKDVAASARHSMYLMMDSTVKYTGIFNSTSRYYPFEVKESSGGPALDSIVAIAAGSDVMLALHADSTVWAWGVNYTGQLGDGTSTNRFYPVNVKDASGTGILTGIVAIDFFDDVALALSKDGTVWAWGDNGAGQLGVGNTISTLLPRAVLDSAGTAALSGITAIAASEFHCLALADDSTAWAWGGNAYGNLADGTRTARSLPVKVMKDSMILSNIIQIDAGVFLSSFLISDQTALSCGFNLEGQTGTYNTLGEALPGQTLVPCRLFAPQAGFFVSQASGCEGSCIQFTDTSAFSPTKRTWVFEGGDIQSSSDPSPTVCYANPGSFSISLIVENAVGVDSLIEMGFITINPAPVIGAGSDTSACEGDAITLVASGALSYTWNASNSLSCLTCPNPTLLVTVSNSYIVTGLDANGCSNSDTVVVEANPLPVANAGADESVCLGDSVQLQGSGGGDYLWSPAMNASCSTCSDPKIEITAASEFVLQVTDVNGCIDSDTVAVTLAPAPVADFSFALDSSVFTIATTDLSLEAKEVIWTFGDGNSDTTANASHTYTANGQYEICMITINDCGRDTICQQVEILSVGIQKELASELFTIDPNPSSGLVVLRFSRNSNEGEVLISDLQGKVVQRITVRPTPGMTVEAELPLPSGMYMYWFESNDLRTSATSILIRR